MRCASWLGHSRSLFRQYPAKAPSHRVEHGLEVGGGLAPVRDKVVIATRFGFDIDPATGQRSSKFNSKPDHIRSVVEPSLKRLRTDPFGLSGPVPTPSAAPTQWLGEQQEGPRLIFETVLALLFGATVLSTIAVGAGVPCPVLLALDRAVATSSQIVVVIHDCHSCRFYRLVAVLLIFTLRRSQAPASKR